MFFLAETTVRTNGINLAAVLAIVLPMIATLVGIATYLDSRSKRREDRRETFTQKMQSEYKEDITNAVNNLRDVLLERLETKEAVNQVRIELAGVKVQITELRERVIEPHAVQG